MVRRKSVKDDEGWSYEEKVAQVEGIIARIETGELELNQVFEEFATAVEFLRECEGFLQSSVQRVDLLIESLQDED
ncbi:MAG: exodeoxyribonuclease VII small subunit [Cyanomargarita calcarea GSE-NOS-MK-12-04C]|jgi:exodeoxyribonuclease VII small subunit|uniref:Exodeoxyribonuclease 7 small subunit n=1 Tax=Cyanomargarita calcarea GSE-NOS-MK-12-04C TaxID=2839659 RepID=A0A951UWC1_9CYAN|nr:exodeoxyribonuclease VII small subunit [Cyanomargarita calcarea GSE-NOS-MK-12-04C]